MSWVHISLRLVGEWQVLEQAVQVMTGLPVEVLRRGERYGNRWRPQPENVMLLTLAEWDDTPNGEEGHPLPIADAGQLLAAATTLSRLAPTLAGLDRGRCRVELYVDTIRSEDDGGFALPSELITAAAAGLSMELSIGVLLEDGDAPEEASEDKPKGGAAPPYH